MRDPLYVLHRSRSGYTELQLRPWAAGLNAFLLSVFCWTTLVTLGHLLWSALT